MNNKTPSEYFNLPVIGKIWCKLNLSSANGKSIETPVDEFDVIKVIDKGDVKVYMCNVWNSYLEPQIVADICVIRYEEK